MTLSVKDAKEFLQGCTEVSFTFDVTGWDGTTDFTFTAPFEGGAFILSAYTTPDKRRKVYKDFEKNPSIETAFALLEADRYQKKPISLARYSDDELEDLAYSEFLVRMG